MNIRDQINNIKCLLEEAELEYQHAFAKGDWETCSYYKGRVASYRSAIGRLVKQKLAIR